jgi:hypothetical protein
MNTMMTLLLAAATAGGTGAPEGRVEADPPGGGVRHAISIELRGGAGTGEYHAFGSGGERTTGGNWRAQVSYAPLPFAAVHVGYGRASFGCEGGFCVQAPVTFTGSGFDAGITLGWRMAWLQAGVLSHELEAAWQGTGGPARERATSDIGITAAAGLEFPIAAGLSITPGVRWLRHGAAFPPADGGSVVHVIGDVGIRYRIAIGR